MISQSDNISETGEGLSVVIAAEYEAAHEWMTFSLWRSISLYLPDATVSLVIKRGGETAYFRWGNALHIPIRSYIGDIPVDKGMISSTIVVSPDCVCLNKYCKNSVGPVNIRSDEHATFYTYSQGVGTFKPTLNQKRSPFRNAEKRFADFNMSFNEIKLLKLWGSFVDTYNIVS